MEQIISWKNTKEGEGMQKLNWKFIRKCRKYYFAVVIIFLLGICTKAYACELELEKKTESEAEEDITYFNVQYSKDWTSKGREILSYDVSQNGGILITFPDHKAGVFDEDMNFLFELSFQGSGAYGAVWYGENILLVNIRGDTAVECDMNGKAVGSYIITGPSSYYYNIVKRRRNCGEYEYYCTNNSWDGSDSSYYEYYTILRRTSRKNGREILYKSGNLLDGVQYIICIFLLIAAGFFAFFLRLAAIDHKYTKIMDGKPFEGSRIYGTDYSMDDCIGLLSRKNIYDVFKFSFQMKCENMAELIVTGYHKCSQQKINVCFEMQFEFEENRKTKIIIRSLFVGNAFLAPHIPQIWMDEFMAQKLDALPIDTGNMENLSKSD